jgi:hypothetical protein
MCVALQVKTEQQPRNFNEKKEWGFFDRVGEVDTYTSKLLELLKHREIFLDEVYEFAIFLKKKYIDEVTNYRTYHLLIGSNPLNNQLELFFDFPGEDSVINFINLKWEKYLLEKKENIT